jgi:hypothetical protein
MSGRGGLWTVNIRNRNGGGWPRPSSLNVTTHGGGSFSPRPRHILQMKNTRTANARPPTAPPTMPPMAPELSLLLFCGADGVMGVYEGATKGVLVVGIAPASAEPDACTPRSDDIPGTSAASVPAPLAVLGVPAAVVAPAAPAVFDRDTCAGWLGDRPVVPAA